jgi:hypothetical protein
MARRITIAQALLQTAQHFYAMQGPLAKGRTLAQFVVALNDLHCATAATHAAGLLREDGVANVAVHGLGWHILLRDAQTDTLYDVENLGGVPNTPEGQASLWQGRRLHEVNAPGASWEQVGRIREGYAARWAESRLVMNLLGAL